MKDIVVTFDIDGVIAGGDYIPEWDRLPEVYLGLPLLDPSIPSIIHEMAKRYSIYLLSSRSYPGALTSTRLWLGKVGFYLPDFSGVVVGLSPSEKAVVASLLESVVHVDDDWRVVEKMGRKGVLFMGGSGWSWTVDEKRTEGMVKVRGWKEIERVVETYVKRTLDN